MPQIHKVIPKLPSRDLAKTRAYYCDKLGFTLFGSEYPDYLMLQRDGFEIHFFQYRDLDPLANYGQCYIRTIEVAALYDVYRAQGATFASLGHLEAKPWGMLEFSALDPDHNLLTFGEEV